MGLAAPVHAQSLRVVPVNIQMAPGQRAASLTITNTSTAETSFQVRAFNWSQAQDGHESLTPSDEVLASPPISTIAPGATQLVRLIIRKPAEARESTYRIVIDQIPTAAGSGTVRIALRLLIPVFALPSTRVFADVTFHVERGANGSTLVATNAGTRHETMRDLVLTTVDGRPIAVSTAASPHLLAGASLRWRLTGLERTPPVGGNIHLVARGIDGAIDRLVPVMAAR